MAGDECRLADGSGGEGVRDDGGAKVTEQPKAEPKIPIKAARSHVIDF